VKMRCCEKKEKGLPVFELQLEEPLESDGQPYLGFEIPEELHDCLSDDYEGACFLIIDFNEVLDEYLDRFWAVSNGKGTPAVIDMLRRYASRIERKLIEYRITDTLLNE